MKLLLQFAAVRCRRSVDQLVIEQLTAPLVLDFLADLETSRGNTIRTRNSRLAAVQTFFRYVAGREPALAATCSPVLAIPAKKALRPVLGYLSEQELGHLLAQIDRLAKHGERDYVLLSILYDTGARIQELLDLSPLDFHLDSPPFVCVRGKGRRERLCPLLPQSARLVRQFLSTQGRQLNEQQPFLQNGRGGRLGRHGARYILVKYLRRAARSMPALSRVGISPHTMRHTKAMHLLQSGVPLVMVKDFLGHVDMKSTEVYVQADLDMKRKALDSANGPQPTQAPTPRLSSSLIEWLEAL
jgi:site-specific recombinase XerD